MTQKWVGVCTGLGLAVVLAAGLPARAHAAGYALNEANSKLLGMAYAGTAALAEDATTGYYNVAGLNRIKQGSLVGTVTGYLLALDFQTTSATNYGKPVFGQSNVDPTRDVAVPTFHLAYRLHPRWVVGFGVTVPYGLEMYYPSDSDARYVATKSSILSYNLNPMISYRINEEWSVGAGFNAQFFEGKLSQTILVPFPTGPTRDGALYVKADDWGWGANFGILYEPNDEMRFGVNYRSQINYDLAGPAQVNNVPGIKSGNASAPLTTPDTVTASALVTVLPDLQLLGDVAWTNWSVFQELNATFDNGLPNFIVLENFRDAWRASLGANYDLTNEWSVRTGFAFDQSPVHDNNRTIRLPDASRWFLGAGVGYHLTDDIRIDFGYMHVFFQDGTVNETDEQPGMANIRGNYSGGSGNLLSLQGTYNFDHLFQFVDSLKEKFDG